MPGLVKPCHPRGARNVYVLLFFLGCQTVPGFLSSACFHRYYYKTGILERVDRRLVYKFGKNAHGWQEDKLWSAQAKLLWRISVVWNNQIGIDIWKSSFSSSLSSSSKPANTLIKFLHLSAFIWIQLSSIGMLAEPLKQVSSSQGGGRDGRLWQLGETLFP